VTTKKGRQKFGENTSLSGGMAHSGLCRHYSYLLLPKKCHTHVIMTMVTLSIGPRCGVVAVNVVSAVQYAAHFAQFIFCVF